MSNNENNPFGLNEDYGQLPKGYGVVYNAGYDDSVLEAVGSEFLEFYNDEEKYNARVVSIFNEYFGTSFETLDECKASDEWDDVDEHLIFASHF